MCHEPAERPVEALRDAAQLEQRLADRRAGHGARAGSLLVPAKSRVAEWAWIRLSIR